MAQWKAFNWNQSLVSVLFMIWCLETETKKFGGCPDQDQSRLNKSWQDQDFIKSLANHWCGRGKRQRFGKEEPGSVGEEDMGGVEAENIRVVIENLKVAKDENMIRDIGENIRVWEMKIWKVWGRKYERCGKGKNDSCGRGKHKNDLQVNLRVRKEKSVRKKIWKIWGVKH